MAIRRVTLSVQIPDGDAPPREVRLLRAGENESEQGDFIFDEAAAADVMALWETHTAGNDHPGMVDLEHLSLDPLHPNFDPDARAWFDLELRDGELWLVDMKWCPDGVTRVSEKRQRYFSPTFKYDTSTRRVRQLINVGLTALPALHGAPELIAARAAIGELTMAENNAKAVADILKALGVDPKMPAKVAAALGLDAGASIDDISAAIDGFAAKMAKVEELLSDGAEPATADAPAEPAAAEPAVMAEPAAEPPVEEEQVEARLDTGEELVTLRAFKAGIEEKERVTLARKLVTDCGFGIPVVWATDAAKTPAEPWASMSLTSLREFVDKAAKSTTAVQAPTSASSGGLTQSQLAICKEYKLDPERFAQLRQQAGR